MVNYKKKYFKYKCKYYNLLGGMELQPQVPNLPTLSFEISPLLQLEIDTLLLEITKLSDKSHHTLNERLNFYIDQLLTKLSYINEDTINKIVEKIKDEWDKSPKTFKSYLTSNWIPNKELFELKTHRTQAIENFETTFITNPLTIQIIAEKIMDLKLIYESPDDTREKKYRIPPNTHKLLYILGDVFLESSDTKLKYLYILIYPLLCYFNELLDNGGQEMPYWVYFRSSMGIKNKFLLNQHKISLHYIYNNLGIFTVRLNIDTNELTTIKELTPDDLVSKSKSPLKGIKVNNPNGQISMLINIKYSDLEDLDLLALLNKSKFYCLDYYESNKKFIVFEDFQEILGSYLGIEPGDAEAIQFVDRQPSLKFQDGTNTKFVTVSKYDFFILSDSL